MTATLLHDDRDRQVLRFERRLRHDIRRAWSAISEPAELAHWFPAAVDLEPRAGARMRFDLGGGFDMTGEVLVYDPPRELAFLWGDDELRFELSELEDGCLLVFTHAFVPEAGRPARDAAGWEACFEAFDRVLDGRPRSPDEAEPAWPRHYAAYLELLGEIFIESDAPGEDPRRARQFGGTTEIDGRAALAVHLVPPLPGGEDPVLVVVREQGRRLIDGAPVDVRAGTPEDPGPVIARGVLRDALTAARSTRS
jgi:uncharacterized protein YndB with AHSA1/START domain